MMPHCINKYHDRWIMWWTLSTRSKYSYANNVHGYYKHTTKLNNNMTYSLVWLYCVTKKNNLTCKVNNFEFDSSLLSAKFSENCPSIGSKLTNRTYFIYANCKLCQCFPTIESKIKLWYDRSCENAQSQWFQEILRWTVFELAVPNELSRTSHAAMLSD